MLPVGLLDDRIGTGLMTTSRFFCEQFGIFSLSQFFEITKGRQVLEVTQPELLEKDLGRSVQNGTPGNILSPDDANEFLFEQGAQDSGGIDAANAFNVGSNNRLFIRNNRQRLQG